MGLTDSFIDRCLLLLTDVATSGNVRVMLAPGDSGDDGMMKVRSAVNDNNSATELVAALGRYRFLYSSQIHSFPVHLTSQ